MDDEQCEMPFFDEQTGAPLNNKACKLLGKPEADGGALGQRCTLSQSPLV
jgi:hypothetical protein